MLKTNGTIPATETAPVRITHVTISNFMGIRDLSVQVPPAGVVRSGRNGSGKTSFLAAITTALTGQGVDPSAIRAGASKAEILIDLGHVSVCQTITRTKTGGSLTVSSPDGFERKAPRTYLNALLGASPINPLQLWLEKDAKKRRAMLLAAMPISITAKQLKAWCVEVPFSTGALAGSILGGVAIAGDETPIPGHGVEILAKVRGYFYDKRKATNAKADELQSVAFQAQTRHADAVATFGDAPVLSELSALAKLDEARIAASDAARVNLAADAWTKRVAGTQTKIAGLRGSVDLDAHPLPVAPTEEEFEEARGFVVQARHAACSADDRVIELEQQLRDARAAALEAHAALTSCSKAMDAMHALVAATAQAFAKRTAALEQADALEAGIGEPPPTVSPDDCAILAGAVPVAEKAVARARGALVLNEARVEVTEAEAKATAARAESAALDTVVKRLTNEAPVELFAASSAIPGLVITDDDVLLDDVSLDRKCGAEKLLFALDVAKRVSTSRLLILDGLEALDPEAYALFLAHAADGGFQIFGTRVASGEQVIEPLGDASTVEGGAS